MRKIIIACGLLCVAAVSVGSYILTVQNDEDRINHKTASQGAFNWCSKASGVMYGALSSPFDKGIMDECLRQRDLVYASAQNAETCRQIRVANTPPEQLTVTGRQICHL
jgi:hypothetical protein